MKFLSLTESTASAALQHLPTPVQPPSTELSPSHTATALEQVRITEQSLIDAHVNALSSHLESIASFATDILHFDDAWAGRFDRD